MAKKQVEEKPKKSFEEMLVIILEKLARREVGVDVDIAELKAAILPEPVETKSTEETTE